MTTNGKNSAMTGNVYRAKNIDMNNFRFEEPEINKYGGKSCSVLYNGKPLYIQTPRCRLPYCLGKYEDKDPKTGQTLKTKYSLDFSLAGYELQEDGTPNDPRVREFYDWAESMQELLVKTAHKNGESWLGMEDVSEGVAKALVRPLLRWSKDKQTKKITKTWPPTVKAKVGFWDGRYTLNAFIQGKTDPVTGEKPKPQRVEDLDEAIVPRTEAIGILKLTGVNFAGGKVGYSFSVHQVKLYEPEGMPSYAFIDDEEDERPVVSGVVNDKDDVDEDEDDKAGNSNQVVDSDEDEDDDSDDDPDELDQESEDNEPEPDPAPVTKKVVRRKKKATN